MSLLHLAHAVAVGAFLTAATLLLDGALRGRGLPTRGLWILALVATVTAPFWGPRLSGVDPALGAAASPAAAAPYAPAEPAPRGAYSLRQRLRAATLQPLPALPLLWLALAGLTTGTVGIGLLRLERKARRWPRAMLAGEEVAVSPAFGPAVVGVHRPRTVVPAWVLGLARREIELIVAHERAHRAAGDAALLAGGLLLAALCPWNPFLWVQFRGLRDAVEMDCDRRLLRSGVSRPAYARVLVLVRLRGTAVGGATAALVESNSSLERRLRSMRMFPWSGRKTVLSAAAALTMVVLACETPAPAAVGPDETDASPGDAVVSTVTPLVVTPEGSHEPLVIVDGEEVEGADGVLHRLDPDAIDRIEVIKGGAARAIYGERAADGVIHIFTKEASQAGATAEGPREVRFGPRGDEDGGRR